MANKTPFEIRTDLLHQAQNILNERMYAERQRLENDWNCQRDIWFSRTAAVDDGKDLPQPPYPTMSVVTTEEIIEEARKLNDFVSKG